MRRRNTLLGIALGLTLLVLSTPAIIRWRVRSVLAERYPDVRVERIDPQWESIQFHEVYFSREWIKGHLDLVTVPWNEKTVDISGGTVVVDLDKRPSGGERESKKLVAEHLSGTVSHRGITANFTDLRYSDGIANAPEVTIKHPKYGIVDVKGVAYADNVVSAEDVSVTLPTFAGHDLGEAHLHKLLANPKKESLWVEQADFPKLRAIAKSLTVEREEDHFSLNASASIVSDPRIASAPITFLGIKIEAFPESGIVKLWKDEGLLLTADVKNRALAGKASCRSWIDLLPVELRAPVFQELQFSGNMSFELQTEPKVKLSFLSTCKASCEAASLKALRKSFAYPTQKPDGSADTRTTGPGVSNWTPLNVVSRHMITALTTMEDPGFFSHQGFIRQALENSIRDDLKADKFLRGGSTLTMQLAKNLWLTHEKTLGRKAQEAFLTMALEGCLTKDEILGLYVNVVEFGRGLYGIGPAARHYFKGTPATLTPEEAFYLVSILPHPRTASPPDESTMTRIRGLMTRFATEGRIPDLLGAEAPADATGWEPSP